MSHPQGSHRDAADHIDSPGANEEQACVPQGTQSRPVSLGQCVYNPENRIGRKGPQNANSGLLFTEDNRWFSLS